MFSNVDENALFLLFTQDNNLFPFFEQQENVILLLKLGG